MSPRIDISEPDRCPICGYYFTINEKYVGCRCLDPGHWQAAGLLSSLDFYPMARIAARANLELSYRVRRKVAHSV